MRVGHFLAHYPSVDGATNLVSGLSEALVAAGHSQCILTARTSVEAAAPPGVEVRHLDVPNAAVMRTLLRMHRPQRADRETLRGLDVLVAHGMFHRQALWVARAARSLGVPVVVAPLDPYVAARFVQNGLRKTAYWHLFERGHLARAAAIHVLAPSHEQALRSRGISTPVFAIASGLDGPTLHAPVHDPPDLQAGLRLVFVGRHDIHNKGIDLLLRAIARASLAIAVELVLVGPASEPARQEIATLARQLGIESRIQLLGVVDDVRAVVESCHALVLPSRTEGFGIVVLEALAAGRPVIVSSGAGASEWFGDWRGVVVAEPEPDALGAAIVSLGEDYPAALQQVLEGRVELEREFSWNSLAARWSDALSAVVRASR